MSSQIIIQIREELNKNVDPVYREGSRRYFKEKLVNYGVRTPVTRKISQEAYAKIKGLEKQEIFSLCEELLRSDYSEEATIALDWSYKQHKNFEEKDFFIFEKWLKKYVNNWAKCDDFCTHSIGIYIEMFPKQVNNLKIWAKDKNLWLRRAAAVTLILPARKGKYLKEIFEIADILLNDDEDLVQKGYGWMLKEAGNLHQKETLEYLMKNKKTMPRTALRYAIEKFPEDERRLVMGR